MVTRGKGEGAVYRRPDGLWAAAIELPRITGQRRRKTVTSKSKPELLRKLAVMRADLNRTGDLPTASMTVEQWFTYWLNIAAKDARPKTIGDYRSMSKNHIIPVIGKIRLDKLSPAHIYRVHDNMRHLSPASAKAAHRVMSTAFTAAEREGRIQRNPAKLARAPRSNTPTLEVLTAAEVSDFIGRYRNEPDVYLWITFMLTGGRRGEILGLEWDRVTDVLDLSWQLQRHSARSIKEAPKDYEHRQMLGGLYLTRPKSKAGWRIVPLVEPLRGVLEQWRTKTGGTGLVFTQDGNPIDPDKASKTWPAVLKAAGIDKHVRLHDLRHTAVDMMYEAGIAETTIQEIVGHSSRSMTRAYKSRGNRPQLTDGMTRLSALLGIESHASGYRG